MRYHAALHANPTVVARQCSSKRCWHPQVPTLRYLRSHIMTNHKTDDALILAVFPSVRGFGFALFHGAWVPLD